MTPQEDALASSQGQYSSASYTAYRNGDKKNTKWREDGEKGEVSLEKVLAKLFPCGMPLAAGMPPPMLMTQSGPVPYSSTEQARMEAYGTFIGGIFWGGMLAGGLAAPGEIVQFGKTADQISHTFRHLVEKGISISESQTAILKDLETAAALIPENAALSRTVLVAGREIVYRAFRLANGIINVGRITAGW